MTHCSLEDSYFASFPKKFLHKFSVFISSVIPGLGGDRAVRTGKKQVALNLF